MAILKFTNCILCDRGELIANKDLYVDSISGKIIDEPKSDSNDFEEVDLEGLILAPGFIDIQINGFFGFDFSHLKPSDEFEKGYENCMKELIKTGVTSICPTMVTSTPQNYRNILPILGAKTVNDKTESLGAHCEGPFISPNKRGCHEPRNLQVASNGVKSFTEVYGGQDCLKYIKIVTAAPEIEGVMEIIPQIVNEGIVYSIGHTNATYDTSVKAVEQGARLITHMYNAMPQPHHREPGIVGLVGDPRIPYFGLVADGVHVHHASCGLVYHANPDKCCLVSDAMNLFGLPDGTYPWEDRFVVKKGSVLKLQGTDTIAGSATELPVCVRNLVKWGNIPLQVAIQTVTNNPAKSIHLEHKKGFLDVGCDADFTVVDSKGYVKKVFKMGRKVHESIKRTRL